MKRLTIRIFLFLLLGAIINVAVAWACEYFDRGPANSSVVLTASELESIWKSFAPHAWIDAPFDAKRFFYDTTIKDDLALSTGDDNRWMHVMYAGWPCKSVCGAILRFYGPQTLVKEERLQVVEWVELEWAGLRPIWPGFAINTVFYAVGLWGLFAGPFVMRRWRRIRRGLCPKCAYDLRATQAGVCPECGATR